MFPNKHNVYLHDTPNRELFGKAERSFSSGCIRVHNPIDLAAWLLDETPLWPRDAIDSLLEKKAEKRVNLAKKVPVHLLYFTASSDQEGNLRLVRDIYDRDTRLIKALSSPPPAEKSTSS